MLQVIYFEFPLKIGWREEGYRLLFPNQMGGQGSALPRSASQCVVLLQWIIKPFESSAFSLLPNMHARYMENTPNQLLNITQTLATPQLRTVYFARLTHFIFSPFSFVHNKTWT